MHERREGESQGRVGGKRGTFEKISSKSMREDKSKTDGSAFTEGGKVACSEKRE